MQFVRVAARPLVAVRHFAAGAAKKGGKKGKGGGGGGGGGPKKTKPEEFNVGDSPMYASLKLDEVTWDTVPQWLHEMRDELKAKAEAEAKVKKDWRKGKVFAPPEAPPPGEETKEYFKKLRRFKIKQNNMARDKKMR